jgi:hypothetical protein
MIPGSPDLEVPQPNWHGLLVFDIKAIQGFVEWHVTADGDEERSAEIENGAYDRPNTP